MRLKADATIKLSALQQKLEERFGLGSRAQEEWSKTVWEGSAPYMPMDTGAFIAHSWEVSRPLFAEGELVYQPPPGVDYPYLPRFLWTGQSEGVKGPPKIIQNYTQSTNAKAGGQWTTRAANDFKPVWLANFQAKVSSGEI